ncbi:hypothetical protein H4582DRAFT_1974859 [Lactarius indigo]|nr:hypothetical protein H4582DRAFT_1974859 [Lactarius indigo]
MSSQHRRGNSRTARTSTTMVSNDATSRWRSASRACLPAPRARPRPRIRSRVLLKQHRYAAARAPLRRGFLALPLREACVALVERWWTALQGQASACALEAWRVHAFDGTPGTRMSRASAHRRGKHIASKRACGSNDGSCTTRGSTSSKGEVRKTRENWTTLGGCRRNAACSTLREVRQTGYTCTLAVGLIGETGMLRSGRAYSKRFKELLAPVIAAQKFILATWFCIMHSLLPPDLDIQPTTMCFQRFVPGLHR